MTQPFNLSLLPRAPAEDHGLPFSLADLDMQTQRVGRSYEATVTHRPTGIQGASRARTKRRAELEALMDLAALIRLRFPGETAAENAPGGPISTGRRVEHP